MRQKTFAGVVRLLFACSLLLSGSCGTAERICKEGESIPFEGDCGTCVCKYGAWSCSTRCGGGDGDTPALCQAGQTRTEGCNTCSCTDGAWSCTEKDCEPACISGATVTVDCGLCNCDSTGQWDCQNQNCAVPTCQLNQSGQCGRGEYCYAPDETLCGFNFALGVCRKAGPDDCDDIYDPVCGCDGKTYSNDCQAQAAGMSIVLQDECPTIDR